MPRRSLVSEAARLMASKRRHPGRKRSEDAERCPCGMMTLKRAEARGKSSEHDPSCSFYRERAIIV